MRGLRAIPGVAEVVSGLRSLAVIYDEEHTNEVSICREIQARLRQDARKAEVPGRLVRIPVVYGGEYGPDLMRLSRQVGLSPEEITKLHSSVEYRVTAIGFLPGFPYLEPLPRQLSVPRLETPRPKVSRGSVGIAQGLTGIYPCDAPGGWWIIGRTDVPLFDVHSDPPAALAPGDRIRFVPVEDVP